MVAFVARERELNVLDDAFAAATAGWRGAVVVSGAAGSGRTELLRAFGVRVGRAGARVVWVTRSGGAAAEVDAVSRAVEDIWSLRAGAPGSAGSLPWADVLRPDRPPLVVVVENVTSADAESLGSLDGFLRASSVTPFLIVVTTTGDGGGLCADDGYSRRIELGPLPVAAVAEIFAASPGFLPTTRVVRYGHQITGGNPALVRALVADYEHGPAPAAGDRFAEAVSRGLRRCGAEAAEVARVVAVLGQDVSPRLVAALVPAGRDAANRGAAELAGIGLLDGVRFRYAGTPALVLAGLPGDERAKLHGKVGKLLHDEGFPAATVAVHLAAADHIDERWGLAVLEDAAASALRDDDVTLAIGCLRLAGQVCSDLRASARITTELLRAQWLLNPSAVRVQLSPLLRALRAGRLDRRDASTLAGCLFWTGRVDDAMEVVAHLATGSPGLGDEQVGNITAWLDLWYPGRAGGIPRQRSASREPSPPRAPRLLGHGVGVEGMLGMADFLAGRKLEHPVFGEAMSAFVTLAYGDPGGKVTQPGEIRYSPADRELPVTALAILRATRAMTAIRRGDVTAAAEHALFALDQVPAESWGVAIGVPLACGLLAATAMGQCDKADQYLRTSLPDDVYQTPFGVWYLRARGHYHLSTGRPTAALHCFESCGNLLATWSLEAPELAPWRVDVAAALLRLDRGVEARALVDEQLAVLDRGHHRIRGMALRVRAATEPAVNRPPLLEKAATLLLRSGDRLELARVFTDLARAYRAIGECHSARIAVQKAAELAERCGAVPLCDAIAAEFGDFRASAENPPGTAGFADLSESERRVATLASQGYTNRQIAKRLYITVSTVEQHLTRVYRKLRVRRRAELLLRLQHGVDVPALHSVGVS